MTNLVLRSSAAVLSLALLTLGMGKPIALNSSRSASQRAIVAQSGGIPDPTGGGDGGGNLAAIHLA